MTDQQSNGSNNNNQPSDGTGYDNQQPSYGQQNNTYQQQPGYGGHNPSYQQQPGGFSDLPPVDKTQFPHSKLGIASFIISMLAIIGIIITIILGAAVVSDIVSDEQLMNELKFYSENPEAYVNNELMESKLGEAMMSIIGAFVVTIGSIVLSFIGVILGIIALSSKNKKKTFGLLGVIFNGLVLVGTVGLFILGLVLGAAGI